MAALAERLAQEDRIIKDIKSSLSMVDALCDPLGNVAYASSPITTGQRMYDLFKQYGVTTLEDLKAIDPKLYTEQIMNANIREGLEFGNELRGRGLAQVIVPGKFFAQGWTQDHYMSLWEQVIAKFATQLHFNNGWQYSSGCTQEFYFGMERNLPLFARNGQILNPATEVGRVRIAVDEIDQQGVDPTALYNAYRRIELAVSEPRAYSIPT